MYALLQGALLPPFSLKGEKETMKRIELTPRLQAVASFVPKGARLADIGTDHAYLPVSLILDEQSPGAVAADLRPGPLDRARKTAAEYGCTDKVTFRLCDGLSDVKSYETDAIAIAGMGGETIAQILGDDEIADDDPRLFVLQPMSRANLLREYLAENEFEVLDFVLCKDGGHLYECFSVRKGKKVETDPLYRYVGRQHHADDALYKEYLTEYRRRLLTILAGHAASSAVETEETAKQRALAAALDQLLR